MAKQFDDDQVAALQRIIRAHEHGLDANTGEWFAPPQKPLTYDELAEFRRMLRERSRASELGMAAANRAIRFVSREAASSAKALSETFLPPRPTTSMLLFDAANMIRDAVSVSSPYKPPLAFFMGKDWKLLCDQLRDRAAAFKTIEDMP